MNCMITYSTPWTNCAPNETGTAIYRKQRHLENANFNYARVLGT